MTTAADVYSLGVVLYELLTHRSPYKLKTRTPSEIFRAVCEQQPEPPSAAIRRDTASEPDRRPPATGPASGDVFRLQRRLKGDLDTILMKALRKEPHQRYLSVEAFADDLERFLDGKPVAARRPTLAYRTQKFLRRHWLPDRRLRGRAGDADCRRQPCWRCRRSGWSASATSRRASPAS